MATGLSLYGDGEEDSIFLTKDEAMDTEVLPRSRGLSLSSRTAIPVPQSSAVMTDEKVSAGSDFVTHEDLIGLSRKPIATDVASPTDDSQEFVTHEDLLGLPKRSAPPVGTEKPKEETGDFLRGAGTALAQTPALAYGALGLAGAAGEKAFGTGGSMSAIKKFGLDQYQTRMKEIGATAKESDDVTKAWAKAKQGDIGALADWAQYGVGYLGGNIVETVATSALGSAIGGLTAGPAGAVAGAGAGVVGRQAVQGVAKNLIEGMVAKESVRLAEGQAAKSAVKMAEKDVADLALSTAIRQQATKNVAKGIGSSMALVGSSLIKETGGIYGEAEEQARGEGRELDGGDLARIFGSGIVAGLSEFAVDKLGLDVAAGKIKIPGGGRAGRSLIGGAAGVGFEGGTELFQTAVERFGAGKTLTGEDAMNEYINAFALGGLGGGTVGAVVGAFRDGKTSPDRVRQILDQAQSDMTSDDGRQELFDSMFDDPNLGPILQANGIESGDDPRFQNVITRALATQRMLVDLEAPTPEARAETRKQREADVLAAFGETASTAVGGDTGAIEPVIQRASVTPNLETRTLEGEAQPVILPETAGGQAGTIALSPEDLVARQQGFEPLVGITTDKGPVGNRFPSMQAAEFFLLGPKDAKTGQRSGGYAQTNLLGQGLEARIRQGKRSKAEGGGTFYFIETRKKPEAVTPAPVVTPAAPVTTAAAPVVTPAVTPAAPVTPTKGKKATIPALTPEEEQQQIPLRVRAEEIANELEALGGDKNLISGIRSVITNKRRIQNNDFYEGKLAELKALKGAGVQKTTEQRGVSAYFTDSKRDQGRYNEYKGNADIGPFLQSADDAIQQLTTFINNLGYAVADVNNATPDKRALFAKSMMSQIAGSTSRMLLKREAFDKKYKSASLEQKNKSLVDLQKDLVAAQEYLTKQGEPDATQARQVTEGGEQQRQGAGEQVPAVGEDRGVKAEEQTGGGEAGRGDQPVEGGTQPQEVTPAAPAKPAVDPAMQARVKERINRADEDGGLDFEDVVKLNKMVDDGDLMGAVSNLKRIVESNLGAGSGAKYSLSRTPQPTTTGRDFAYGKIKTIDDLNRDVRGHLARQGSGGTFTATRVPLGNLAGKVPGLPAMQRIADLFGKKLVYFAVEEGSVDLIDGAVLSGSDTIFVNVNSSRPHIRILGHEMVHALRFSNKEIYTALTKHLLPYLDQGGMNAYRAQLSKEGMKDPALILEEAIADIVGDRFGESTFWQMMADENPSMFTQLARIVVDFLDSVMNKIRGRQTLDSKNLLTDVAAARQAIVSVLADFDARSAAPTQPTGLPSFSQKRMDLPSEPGTQEIPDGYVRLYHQTDTESLDNIAKEGLSIKYAKGIEGPRAIYAGETPFYGPVETRPTLEFIVPKEQWDAPFVLQDVRPDQIIAAHYPWHRRVRYLEDNQDAMQKALAGEFDDLDGDYKLAVQYVKDKYGETAPAPSMSVNKPPAKSQEFFAKASEIPEPEGVQIIRENWIGGVSGLGDRDGVYDLYRVSGGRAYTSNVQNLARKSFGESFKGYRLMSRDEYEELKAGSMGSQFVSFTFNPKVAEAFRNLPAYSGRKDLVVVEMDLTPEHINMIGSLGEQEIVVDYGQGYNPDTVKEYGKPTEEAAPPMFSRKREGETFYSAMERGFESVKQTSMPAQQWKAWLNSNKAQLGIKNAEIEWTGINEWFDLQEGKVEKQAVLNWIAGNKVRINDIILTDNPSVALPEYKDPTEEDYREFVRDRIEEQKNNVERTVFGSDFYDLEKDYPELYKVDPDSMTMEEAKQWIQDYSSMTVFNREHIRGYERSLGRAKDRLKARYNKSIGSIQTVLPGGEDYAEIILIDPSIRPYKEEDTIHFGDIAYGKHIGWLRTNVRKDADGNDVLFLEEIQSQRAQEGREQGFADPKRKDLPAGFTVYQDERYGWYVLNESTKRQVGLYGNTKEEAINSVLEIGVPEAPFMEDTKSWTSLLLKRAIAYAQTKGIDRVAWTTGDQQNERYKLSKVVDEIVYDPHEDGSTYQVTAIKDGDEIAQGSGQMDIGAIRRAYGKDVAKLISSGGGEQKFDPNVEPDLTSVKSIKGENLDVGGAGMREFYNTIVPSVAKTIAGKDSVTVMDIEGTGQQLGFVIPEKIQEQVANDGFPMFSRKRYEEQFSDLDEKTKNTAMRKGYYSPPTIKERLDHLKPRLWDRIIQGTFDKFRAVRGISEKAYMMLRMSSGSQDGAVSALLHYGQVYDDDGALNVKKGTKGLLEALDPVGGEVDRFLLWIAANRAANLSKDERERFFSQEDIRQLQKLNMGTMKNGKSRIGVYAEALKNMNELNRSVLDLARTTGLIDADAYKRFSADIWYVPFYRQMEDDGSLSAAQTSSGAVGQYLSKKLKGSDRPLNDLMENVLMNWSHILSASMKNKAAVETLKAATDMGDIVTKLPAQMKGAVKVMESGKETYYQIDDEFLMSSLSAVSQMPTYGFFWDTARGFKTTLTRFISLSPTFKINNLIRDSIQSIGLSELSNNPLGNVMQGWRAYKDERAEALAGGGLFAMGNAFDGDQSASVKRLLKSGVNKADILDTPEKVASFFRSAQDKYDEISDASENANRLALYQQLRAKGASHLEAAYAARDLQDFSLQGSWTAIRYAAMVLPYFNARLQGMYKLGRDGLDPTMQVLTGKASDTERQKAAKFATVTGAVVATAFILYLSQKDDEDWKKREDWDRDAFFWFKIPGTDKAVRIPKPFEMGAIATIFERALEQMVDSSVEGKVFGKRLAAVLHDTFAINPIPQFIRPLYDVARNKDGFTDRPIESMGMERLSVENRVSPGTSGAAVAIGTVNSMFAEFASKVTGGAINSQSVQFSPIQYDYMIKGYLGWVGAGIQTASNVMAAPFKDGSSSRYERIDDFLVVGNYVKTVPQAQSRYVTSFYENAKDVATATSDVSHFLNSGQYEKARETIAESRDKIALSKLYTKGTNIMSTLSNQIKAVEDDKTMSGAEKRLEIERLQQLRIQIAKSVEDVRIGMKNR